jgi:ribosomal protein S18 acetylase RimI-like enzyme
VTGAPPVAVTHHDGPAAEGVLEAVVVPIYAASHADVIGDPFYSAERFAERVRGYAQAPGFEMVVGEIGGRPVGLALGYALPARARWWEGLTTPVDPETIAETGHRTFALCELMVHPDWPRHGVARLLHDELLRHRPEERATLLVREENTAAQRACAGWGWRRPGKLRPYPDAPHDDALILRRGGSGMGDVVPALP